MWTGGGWFRVRDTHSLSHNQDRPWREEAGAIGGQKLRCVDQLNSVAEVIEQTQLHASERDVGRKPNRESHNEKPKCSLIFLNESLKILQDKDLIQSSQMCLSFEPPKCQPSNLSPISKETHANSLLNKCSGRQCADQEYHLCGNQRGLFQAVYMWQFWLLSVS